MESPMDITEMLTASVRRGASDLHLSAGLVPMLRVDGEVWPLDCPVLAPRQLADLLSPLLNQYQQKDFETSLETDFAFELPGVARFRVNVFQHDRGLGAVFRTIPGEVQSLERLGLGEVFQRIAQLPRGLVLVTGPTGSGKSTTLAAMIDHLNQHRRQHILTLEDPIEFIHRPKTALINQRQVHRDTHSFSNALRSALRADPDVILVGELRDLDTIRLALTAAETGHLVFGTLHTTSAAKTVDRLVDVFPAGEKAMVRTMLSESLQAVVAQILVKKITGGRVAAHEIMLATPAIRNLIREDKVAQMVSAIQTGGALGMKTLDMSLKALVGEGVISREEAREKARVPADI
jgi:twitching motility protein PilT